jgi:hypothetical protein
MMTNRAFVVGVGMSKFDWARPRRNPYLNTKTGPQRLQGPVPGL